MKEKLKDYCRMAAWALFFVLLLGLILGGCYIEYKKAVFFWNL